MNNKKIGNEFEKEFCDLLAEAGFWVHFINPDRTGSQPFDIIAVSDNKAIAIDCKTCVAKTFNISRLEDNQIMAFEKWLRCGNNLAVIAVKHNTNVYLIDYVDLKEHKSVKLDETVRIWKEGCFGDKTSI